jgi:hypothetical protein
MVMGRECLQAMDKGINSALPIVYFYLHEWNHESIMLKLLQRTKCYVFHCIISA